MYIYIYSYKYAALKDLSNGVEAEFQIFFFKYVSSIEYVLQTC